MACLLLNNAKITVGTFCQDILNNIAKSSLTINITGHQYVNKQKEKKLKEKNPSLMTDVICRSEYLKLKNNTF